MSEEYTTSCFMLLPRGAVGDEHLTLGYCGEAATGVAIGQLQDRAKMLAQMFQPVVSQVLWYDHLGTDGEYEVAVMVLTLDLSIMRSYVDEFVVSQWGFTPHITAVNGHLRGLGETVVFDRIAVWGPADHRAWRLGSGDECAG